MWFKIETYLRLMRKILSVGNGNYSFAKQCSLAQEITYQPNWSWSVFDNWMELLAVRSCIQLSNILQVNSFGREGTRRLMLLQELRVARLNTNLAAKCRSYRITDSFERIFQKLTICVLIFRQYDATIQQYKWILENLRYRFARSKMRRIQVCEYW